MEVITYEIQQQVRVRKYSTDCKKLCDLLRKHKKMASLSNKEIAKTLNMPITKVEHWFRQDSCFSIPDECIWFELKKLLKITNNEFDLEITTFEEKDNVFEKGNRIYDSQGICPTITCLDSLVVLDRSDEMEVKVIGQMDNTIDHTFESANRVYDVGGVSPTINTCGGGGLQPKILEDAQAIRMVRTEEGKALRKEYESGAIHHGFNEHREMELRTDGVSNTLSTVQKDNYICEKSIVAMRGRNPENPSDRTVGSPTEQRLEPNSQGLCNTLTSVQKDNLVMEPVLVGGIGEKWGDKQYRQGNRVYDSESVAMAVTSQPLGNMGGNSYMYLTREPQYRIRKLTPRECWRLMDFTDEDFEKAAQVNSNTQLYKQAGNSIVKNVLVAILGQMIPGKEDVYRKLETR